LKLGYFCGIGKISIDGALGILTLIFTENLAPFIIIILSGTNEFETQILMIFSSNSLE